MVTLVGGEIGSDKGLPNLVTWSPAVSCTAPTAGVRIQRELSNARADIIFRAGRALLCRETDSTRFRLIGIAESNLAPAAADPPDMPVGGS